MKARVFYETVKELRKAQKEYFSTRNPNALSRSREIERVIDEEIERVEKVLKTKVAVQGEIEFR